MLIHRGLSFEAVFKVHQKLLCGLVQSRAWHKDSGLQAHANHANKSSFSSFQVIYFNIGDLPNVMY